ncbi:MAG: hypothetical protein AAF387_17575 [Pseudomonadota bacterium]
MNIMQTRRYFLTVVTALLFWSTTTPAQETRHFGDVWPIVTDGQITSDPLDVGTVINPNAVSGNPLLSALASRDLFTADFRDPQNGVNGTENPGFDHNAGQFPTDSLLGVRPVGNLLHWDGTSWQVAPNGVTLSVTGVLFNTIGWTNSGTTLDHLGDEIGGVYITQEDGGVIHSHILFEIDEPAEPGAYLAHFYLFSQQEPANLFNPPTPAPDNRSTGIADSAPIGFIFNYFPGQPSDPDRQAAFAAAVDSLTEATSSPVITVPVPRPTLALLIGAILLSRIGLSNLKRKRTLSG